MVLNNNYNNHNNNKMKNVVMAWLTKKGTWYNPTKLSQNVLGSWQSYKVYHRKQEKLESGIDNRRKKFTWGEIPERYIPERRAITITICYHNNTNQPHTYLK